MIYGPGPRVTDSMLRFTGPDAQDRLKIRRVFLPKSWQKPEAGLYYADCKTSRLRYDVVVVACLLAFKNHFPEAEVRSDGFPEELVDGGRLYTQALGRCPIDVRLERGGSYFYNN